MALSMTIVEDQPVELAVTEACERVPPLWPLQDFVAVNPFLGLKTMPFDQAARLLDRVAHRTPLMDTDYYLSQIQNGSISAEDIRSALKELPEYGGAVDPIDPVSWLEQYLTEKTPTERILTVADWLDQNQGTNWTSFIVDEISKWCSSYYDLGQSSWEMPWRDLPLYQAWKRASEVDRNPEAFGMTDFRKYVKALPESDEEMIEYSLGLLNVPATLANDFLHRELMSVFGWSAYAAYQDRQGLGSNTVRQVLAIRLAYDTALLAQARSWLCDVTRSVADFTEAKYIAHLALEHSFRTRLLAQVRKAPSLQRSSNRLALQAVFCIDVRSEPYRRALESQSPEIETLGFAGFFGMPLEVSSTARCPVLIRPGYQVQVKHPEPGVAGRLGQRISKLWKSLARSSSACFSAVEMGGLWFGIRLLEDSGIRWSTQNPQQDLHWTIPLDERVELAANALKNMSVDARQLAKVVLICGHGSTSKNNPYASSLDCGACGGHKGDVNARFAAALMNDPQVRQALLDRGISIPGDTIFVAGLHNTTTDEVALYGSDTLLPQEQQENIERWLHSASQAARRERALTLGIDKPAENHHSLERETRMRSKDWSEVRPEWGLAGNAAFIAAPRSKTKHLNLQGRVFLHDYDPLADTDGSVLKLILTAPVVVASWINLQYFGSTVNNDVFGSGNKVLHNVVGTFGVWEGNGGDLKTGLPLQSLHNGERWIHEPLRLQVLVEAPRDRIDRVLHDSEDIRMLVENHWLDLMAMEQTTTYKRGRSGLWHPVL